jgi:hypothetical protein
MFFTSLYTGMITDRFIELQIIYDIDGGHEFKVERAII